VDGVRYCAQQKLTREVAAIDRQGDAGDVAGHVGGEEDGGTGNVLGRADAAERNAAREIRHIDRILARLGIKRGSREPGADRIDPYAERGEFDRQCLGQQADAAFGGRIGRRVGQRDN